MSYPGVPFHEDAEKALAGAAIWSQQAALAVMAAVDPDDFYAPWFARVVAAGAELGEVVPPNEEVSGRNVRLGALSVLADVELGRLVEWRAAAWTLRRPEPLARHVRDAAARRRWMVMFSEAFAALGTGVGFDRAVAPVLDAVLDATGGVDGIGRAA